MKVKSLFITSFFISIICGANAQVFGQTEATVISNAVGTLGTVYAGQLNYYGVNGSFYPPAGGSCPRNVCWQGSRLACCASRNNSGQCSPDGSGYDLINVLRGACSTCCPGNLQPTVYALGGDVRIRCRRQGSKPDDVWCFAYRCEQYGTAGCKQKWRLRIKLRSDGAPVSADCFDVSGSGACGTPLTVTAYAGTCSEY